MRKSMILVAAALFLPSLAMADIPPPAGYVESCTTDKACRKGDEVDACHAYYGDPQACDKKHDGDGFRFSCRTNGASVWGEVWCRTKEAKAAAGARQQAAKDQEAKEQAAKEQAAKDQAAKDQAAKDQAAKDQAAKDQAAKDQAAKDQAAVTATAIHGASTEGKSSSKAVKTTRAKTKTATKANNAAK